MSNFPPNTTGERDAVKDNARKFIRRKQLPLEFLKVIIGEQPDATIEELSIGWIEIKPGTETKVVQSVPMVLELGSPSALDDYNYSIDPSQKPSRKLITKTTKPNGERTKEVTIIGEDEYGRTIDNELPLKSVEKIRHTFKFGKYTIRYDVFLDGTEEYAGLVMIEVEVSDEPGVDAQADLAAFDVKLFASGFAEVSGRPEYTGWQIADTLNKVPLSD